MTLKAIKAVLSANGMIVGVIIGLLTTGLMWDRSRIAAAKSVGAQEVKTKIDAKGAKDVEKAKQARAIVGAAAPDCLRDPYCRRD